MRGPEQITVRTWPALEVSTVRCRIDDGAWNEMSPLDEGHWNSHLPGSQLDKGEHSLEVVAVAHSLGQAQKRLSFVVDRTGRYTAYPETRPAVRGTRFC